MRKDGSGMQIERATNELRWEGGEERERVDEERVAFGGLPPDGELVDTVNARKEVR